MRILDLFCNAGGAGMGYHRAGFEVVGVDLDVQRNYPFAFIQHDALTLDPRFLRSFDAIHASPPCQGYTGMNAPGQVGAPQLIDLTRRMLQATGLPYVIENVEGAVWDMRDPITLCGSMFSLGAQGCQHSSGDVDKVEIIADLIEKYTYVMSKHNPDMARVAGHNSCAQHILAAISTAPAPVAETAGEAVAMEIVSYDIYPGACWISPNRADEYRKEYGCVLRPLYASPVPAQDDDNLREAIALAEYVCGLLPSLAGAADQPDNKVYAAYANKREIMGARDRLAALKSTAAQEGGE